ncbi:MAG: hypothetical protein CL868_16715 [Cytophagaceae bacterium]|nr:hypothetical protein [Cytophagaceae bacterium]|tara:strand:+ start:13573 stop:15087 length:1515 start_codon:yes stop_codon:yes gene_type:complete
MLIFKKKTMKITIYSKITLGLFLLMITSCQLTEDLDEFKPLYSLPAESAISDQVSADLALDGMYSALRGARNSFLYYTMLGSMLSGVESGGYFATTVEDVSLLNNNPVADGPALGGIYTNLYTLINRANWVIEGAARLSSSDFIDPDRQSEVINEAKAIRALGHFYLLRTFGQFYDVSSNYGIVLNLAPAKDSKPRPRNTVAECYDAILSDLDDAIENAPDLRYKYYTNKTFAKGLKAKVLLYMGDYGNAAFLAKEVIDNSGPKFQLAANFEDLFDHIGNTDYLNSVESLFNVYADLDEPIGGNFWNGIYAQVSNEYYDLGDTGSVTINGQTINYDGGRTNFMQQGTPYRPGFNSNFKFIQSGSLYVYETSYQLRMAEIYLIYAEADARAIKNVSPSALAALNTIRIRAGATSTGSDGFETYPSNISYEELLEAIRIEKLMELATEMGEDWYDLVRYDYADGFGSGFQVSDVKSTATDAEKFIMPIPATSIIAGQNIVKQNPGY